jgi:hypothetical protein
VIAVIRAALVTHARYQRQDGARPDIGGGGNDTVNGADGLAGERIAAGAGNDRCPRGLHDVLISCETLETLRDRPSRLFGPANVRIGAVLEPATDPAYPRPVTRRFTAAGLVIALVVGGVVGAFVWDTFAEADARRPRADPSPARSPKISPDADLLDVVRVVETLPDVAPCRMVEMFEGTPLTVRAFCSTTSGDELRIVHHNDATAQDDDLAAFCDVGDGQGFIPRDAKWSLYQVAREAPADPIPASRPS